MNNKLGATIYIYQPKLPDEKQIYLNVQKFLYNRGSQTGVHVPLGVHLGFSRGTLLCERMSLFKLNSLSGRNNRLKCLEFSNPVKCNYVKQDHSRTFRGGRGQFSQEI